MREFIAIELPGFLKQSLISVKDQLDTGDAKVKWVRPENMHLTIKFLGEIDEEQEKEIAESIENAVSRIQPFNLGIENIGAFPRISNPRVIWAGINKNDILDGIFEKIEKAAVNVGIPPEKRSFSPHLTLGRVKFMKKGSSLPQKFKDVEFESVEIPVSKIVLFRSKLTPEGPIYTKVQESYFADDSH